MTRTAALWDEWVAEDPFGDPVVFAFGAGNSPSSLGPDEILKIRTYLALGADLTAHPSTWNWTEVPPGLVRYEQGVYVSDGRRDESDLVGPGISALTFDNTDGRFSRKNPMGPYYGRLTRNTPIWVTIDAGSGPYSAIQHFVNEWPGRWDKTLTDFTVPIKCGGILRRLTQGAKPLKSAMYRDPMLPPFFPVAYWSLEEDPTLRAARTP
jgi:hypothetical protein